MVFIIIIILSLYSLFFFGCHVTGSKGRNPTDICFMFAAPISQSAITEIDGGVRIFWLVIPLFADFKNIFFFFHYPLFGPLTNDSELYIYDNYINGNHVLELQKKNTMKSFIFCDLTLNYRWVAY